MNNRDIPNTIEAVKLPDVMTAVAKEITARPDVHAAVYGRETAMTHLVTKDEYNGDEYVG